MTASWNHDRADANAGGPGGASQLGGKRGVERAARTGRSRRSRRATLRCRRARASRDPCCSACWCWPPSPPTANGAGRDRRRCSAGPEPQHHPSLHDHAARRGPARAGPALAPLPRSAGRVVGHAPAQGREAGQLELDARAALGRLARAVTLPAVRVGDRAHDRQPQARPAGCAVARGVGAVEAVEDALALVERECPAPSSSTRKRTRSPPSALHAHAHQPRSASGVVDRVAHQVAQRLCEAVGVGAQRPVRDRAELEATARRAGSPRPTAPRTKTGRSIDSMRRNSVCSVLASSSRSSTRRLIRAISACTRRSTRRTSSPRGIALGGQHLELAADHRQRRAQLVRGVGDERALARERVGQTVEHVVEGVGQHRDLVALAARVVDARVQVAGVHARGHRGHPAQRARQARADQIRGEQRAGERQEPGEDERARDALLGVRDGRQRLSDADGDAQAADERAPALEQAQVADVGQRAASCSRRGESAAARTSAVLLCLLGGRLAVVRRPRCRTAPGGWCSAASPGTSANSSVELALNGWSST